MRNNGTATGEAWATTPITEPARSMTTKGHQSLLVPYNRGLPARPDQPITTVTTRDRIGLVDVEQIVDDCGFRMLEPYEVAAAMAFPTGYIPRDLPRRTRSSSPGTLSPHRSWRGSSAVSCRRWRPQHDARRRTRSKPSPTDQVGGGQRWTLTIARPSPKSSIHFTLGSGSRSTSRQRNTTPSCPATTPARPTASHSHGQTNVSGATRRTRRSKRGSPRRGASRSRAGRHAAPSQPDRAGVVAGDDRADARLSRVATHG